MIKVFDFRCLACAHIFEEWVETKDQKVSCPMCDSEKTEVVFIHAPRMQEKKQPYDYIGKHKLDDPIKSYVPKSYKEKRK